MKNARWKIDFASVNNTRYSISIYDRNFDGSTTMLTAAAEPFVTDMDSQRGLFVPLRGSTGYIRIVASPSVAMEIQAAAVDDTSLFVRLMNRQTGSVDWQGFVSSASYGIDHCEDIITISIPVNSILAVADRIPIKSFKTLEHVSVILHSFFTTIAELAGGSISEIFDKVYIPASWWRWDTHLFSFRTLVANWQDVEEFETDETVVKSIVMKSYAEFIEAFCKMGGWTAIDSGQDVMFMQYEAPFTPVLPTGSIYSYWCGSPNILTTETPESVNMRHVTLTDANLNYNGIKHQYRVEPAYNKITVKASVNPHPIAWCMPKLSEQAVAEIPMQDGRAYFHLSNDTDANYEQGASYVVENNTTTPMNNQFLHFTTGTFTATTEDITLHSPLRRTNHQFEGTQGTAEIGGVVYNWNRYVGARLARYAFVKNDGQDKPLYGNAIWLMHAVYMQEGAISLTSAAHITPDIYLNNNGYICISFSAQQLHVKHPSPTLAWGGDLGLTKLSTYTTYFFCLRVTKSDGSIVYWNSDTRTWSSSWAWTKVECDPYGNIVSNKTSAMDTDKSGYFIPVTSEVGGKIDLFIYPVVMPARNRKTDQGVFYFPMESFLMDFEVSVINEKEAGITQRNKHIYALRNNINATREYTVDVPIAFANHDKGGNGLLYTPYSPTREAEIVEKCVIWSGEHTLPLPVQPENHLLGRLAKQLSTPTRIIQITCTRPDLLKFNDGSYNEYSYNGKTYRPIHESINWRNDTHTVTFYEIKE